jgi:hypothetical protein
VSRLLHQLRRAHGAPWGDYGDALFNGISWNTRRVDGLLQLERTGPRIAPVTTPGTGVVITDAVRERLAESGLTGWLVRPVVKLRIVDLDWQSWPPGPNPAKYPAGGEPENYVLGRKHNPSVADALGNLWELTAESGASLCPGPPRYFVLHSPSPSFLTDADARMGLLMDDRGRAWLEGLVEYDLEFAEFDVRSA